MQLEACHEVASKQTDQTWHHPEDCIYIEKADLQFTASSGGDEGGEAPEAAEVEDENVGSVQLLGGFNSFDC